MYKDLKKRLNNLPLIRRSILTGLLSMLMMLTIYVVMRYLTKQPITLDRSIFVTCFGIHSGLTTYAKDAKISRIHKAIIRFVGVWLLTFGWVSPLTNASESWINYILAAFIMSLFFSGLHYLMLGSDDDS